MSDRQKIIQDLIFNLQGTCQSLDEAMEGYELNGEEFTSDDLESEDHETIDSMIACCEQCSWWVEAGDVNDDGKCDDCTED